MADEKSKDPSERDLIGSPDVLALSLARFTLRKTDIFPALEALRSARDSLIEARAKLGKAPTELALAERLDAAIAEARDLVYHARLALALTNAFSR